MKLLLSALFAAASLWLLSLAVAHSRGSGHPSYAEARPDLSEAPRNASSARTAPRPAVTAERAGWPLPGNTDGGHLPWNGGDLHMRDYSGLTHPRDGAPR